MEWMISQSTLQTHCHRSLIWIQTKLPRNCHNNACMSAIATGTYTVWNTHEPFMQPWHLCFWSVAYKPTIYMRYLCTAIHDPWLLRPVLDAFPGLFMIWQAIYNEWYYDRHGPICFAKTLPLCALLWPLCIAIIDMINNLIPHLGTCSAWSGLDNTRQEGKINMSCNYNQVLSLKYCR